MFITRYNNQKTIHRMFTIITDIVNAIIHKSNGKA